MLTREQPGYQAGARGAFQDRDAVEHDEQRRGRRGPRVGRPGRQDLAERKQREVKQGERGPDEAVVHHVQPERGERLEEKERSEDQGEDEDTVLQRPLHYAIALGGRDAVHRGLPLEGGYSPVGHSLLAQVVHEQQRELQKDDQDTDEEQVEGDLAAPQVLRGERSEEHTSELQSH